jgi:hypothetical protein
MLARGLSTFEIAHERPSNQHALPILLGARSRQRARRRNGDGGTGGRTRSARAV